MMVKQGAEGPTTSSPWGGLRGNVVGGTLPGGSPSPSIKPYPMIGGAPQPITALPEAAVPRSPFKKAQPGMPIQGTNFNPWGMVRPQEQEQPVNPLKNLMAFWGQGKTDGAFQSGLK